MPRLSLTALTLVLIGPLPARAEEFSLTLIDGEPPGFVATLGLDTPGRVQGRAPCNRYSASLTGTLPDFAPGAIISTKMACPELEAEQRFLDLLGQMQRADPGKGLLTLTGGGHVMVFASQP